MTDRGVVSSHDISPYVVTLGETLGLLHSEFVGSLSHTDQMRLSTGGAESNVAIALARLGTSVSWIGRVGEDSLGERILREIRAEGVEVHAIVDPHARSGLMLKERRTPDVARIWYYRNDSAGSRLAPEDIPISLIERSALLHVTGITPALSTTARAAVFEAVERACGANVPVSFDVNHRSTIWSASDAVPVYRDLVKAASIVFAGEDEARMIVPDARSVRDLGHALADLGPSQVVIKLGADGCYAFIDGVDYERPAIPINTVDTVGAGDAFVAGYLAELIDGNDVATCLATATKSGAFACLSTGDWQGMPRRHEFSLLTQGDPVTR